MLGRISVWKLLSVAGLLLGLWTSSAFAAAHEDISFDVALRETGSVTIHADVYNNPKTYQGVLTILAIPGMAERGSMYSPLANAIYADPILKYLVKRIIAIDLPVHGLSGPPTLPSPLMFGDLLIEDNAGIVIQAIGILRARGLAPQAIMGHSMGGLTVQLVQEMLLAQGSSLAQQGIISALLIASVPARGTVWTIYPGGGDLTPFIVTDPVLGTIFSMPVYACANTGAFTTLAGTMVPNAPTPETCTVNGWMSVEPITTIAELVGTYCQGPKDDPASLGLCRPVVRQNAFGMMNGTLLTVLGFSQDVLTPFVDQDDLYTYLTGIESGPISLFRPIVADDAVHSMYVSNPAGLISAIKNGLLPFMP